MAKIKIGADELILWLRKNNRAKDIPNDEIHGLGIIIHNIIIKLGGIKKDPIPCYWANRTGDKNIGQKKLPKSATQYEIDTDQLKALYNTLDKL